MEYPLTFQKHIRICLKHYGLNPYSNGIPSDSRHLAYETGRKAVLILILMEYPLTKNSLLCLTKIIVLILILMEYPLTWLLGAIRIRSFMRLNPYSNGIPSDF